FRRPTNGGDKHEETDDSNGPRRRGAGDRSRPAECAAARFYAHRHAGPGPHGPGPARGGGSRGIHSRRAGRTAHAPRRGTRLRRGGYVAAPRGRPAAGPVAFGPPERAGWQRAARHYDDAFGSLTRQAVDPLLDSAQVRSRARTLDVASGPGYAAAAAAARGARVAALDFSSAMVEL